MKTLFAVALSVAMLPVSSGIAQKTKTRSHGKEAKAAKLNVDVLLKIDAAMQNQVDRKWVSGAIGIIARNGTIGYYETFGYRVVEKKKPMDKRTLFRIYSMTKPIVAVTAMSLWEEGKFKLDDPISKHLPEWKAATVRKDGKVVPATTPITPRHLMTHSSGLSYNRVGLKLNSAMTLSEFSKAMAKRPLKFEPGSDYVYGYSIDILGRYIEAIEGKPLDKVMRERVFDKLGMNDTEFWVRKAADRDRIAHVYRRTKQGELVTLMGAAPLMQKPARMMGGQGLISTAADYAKFCAMLLNKGELNSKRVLKQKTVELMFQNHLKPIGKNYGLGGNVNGKGSYYWGGAAGTKFLVDWKTNSYAVFMIQRWRYRAPTAAIFQRLAAEALK